MTNRTNLPTADRDLDPFTSWIERFFGPTSLSTPAVDRAMRAPVNIAESDQGITFEFELPGLDEQDIQVHLDGDHLTVSAERKQSDVQETERLHRVEHSYGLFRRTAQLPNGLSRDPQAVEAAYSKGILTVRVPKAEESGSTRIAVRGEG